MLFYQSPKFELSLNPAWFIARDNYEKIKHRITIQKFILKDPSNKCYRLRRLMMVIGWQLWKRIGGPRIIKTIDNGELFILDPKSGNSVGAIYARICSFLHVILFENT